MISELHCYLALFSLFHAFFSVVLPSAPFQLPLLWLQLITLAVGPNYSIIFLRLLSHGLDIKIPTATVSSWETVAIYYLETHCCCLLCDKVLIVKMTSPIVCRERKIQWKGVVNVHHLCSFHRLKQSCMSQKPNGVPYTENRNKKKGSKPNAYMTACRFSWHTAFFPSSTKHVLRLSALTI